MIKWTFTYAIKSKGKTSTVEEFDDHINLILRINKNNSYRSSTLQTPTTFISRFEKPIINFHLPITAVF